MNADDKRRMAHLTDLPIAIAVVDSDARTILCVSDSWRELFITNPDLDRKDIAQLPETAGSLHVMWQHLSLGEWSGFILCAQETFELNSGLEGLRVAVELSDDWRHTPEQLAIEFCRVAMEISHDIITTVDVNTLEFIDVNRAACEFFKGSHAEVHAAGPALLLNGGSSGRTREEELRETCRRCIASVSQTEIVNVAYMRLNGEVARVQVTRRAAELGGRWILVETAVDLTPDIRVRTEIDLRLRELLYMNAELDALVEIAARNSKLPLAAVSESAHCLAQACQGVVQIEDAEFVNFMISGADRMETMITDLLTYSRAGQYAAQPELVDMGQLIEQVSKKLLSLNQNSDAAIERGPMPSITADAAAITQLMGNVIDNAVKFRGERAPKVRVSARRDGLGWVFSVADNGIGIEKADFERIFVVFQRLHPVSKFGGNGIGLATSKRIVHKAGGHMWLESEVGVGTAVHMYLPDHVDASTPTTGEDRNEA